MSRRVIIWSIAAGTPSKTGDSAALAKGERGETGGGDPIKGVGAGKQGAFEGRNVR